jgi:hypothetical protein
MIADENLGTIGADDVPAHLGERGGTMVGR